MRNASLIITDDIFEAYLNCTYKAYLKLCKSDSYKTDYENLQDELDAIYHSDAQTDLQSNYENDEVLFLPSLTLSDLKMKKSLIIDSYIQTNEFSASFDALKKISGYSKLGSFYYEPIIYYRHKKIRIMQKLLIVFKALVLSEIQGAVPSYGYIIYGDEFSMKKIRISLYLEQIKEKVIELWEKISNAEKIPLILNPHCDICEFSNYCKTEAIKSDNMSLLRGMSSKEIQKLNKEGIFTINQLSYTFRPRKRPKRTKKPTKPHYFALQALSIRENKVHIHGTPEIPVAEVNIFFDIEGIPERDFYYLIGLIKIEDSIPSHHFFWANNEKEQDIIFIQFFEYLQQFSDFHLFHYGSYEFDAFKIMRKRLDVRYHSMIDNLINKLVNVLSVIYPYVYFPTYSNGLKDIGNYLGFKWSDNNASGIQSIIWREIWEKDYNPILKEKLIQYNKEDCLALEVVYNFIIRAISPIENTSELVQYPELIHTNDLKKASSKKHVFGKKEFVLEDLEYVNNRAYFDYQREKVFVRTNEQFKIINRRKRKKKKNLIQAKQKYRDLLQQML